jgi:phosphate/sulfate permease
MFGLEPGIAAMLIICMVAACAFEFINGFHDTANAVATVIYTRSLSPFVAVVWSGIFNFLGVFLGGISVAMGIMHLLPAVALVDPNIYHSVSIILALIMTAIFWNLGTWYFGLPCSSSHTLIGSIFGVGLAFSLIPGADAVALNWSKVKDAGLSLLISPVIGFGLTLGVMILMKKTIKKRKVIFAGGHRLKHPPMPIRALLVTTSTLVSFTHGSNDGQKGVGLVMIILMSLLPAKFAIDSHKSPQKLLTNIELVENTVKSIDLTNLSSEKKMNCKIIVEKTAFIRENINGNTDFEHRKGNENFELRKELSGLSNEINKLLTIDFEQGGRAVNKESTTCLKENVSAIKEYYEFAPLWVLLMISISLGCGTLIGWKRIVVTVGEKIGKTPLSYAQGASSQLIAACTIGFSTILGLPVSTTHVLSSGVAGSMVAENGLKNLRKKTIMNIMIAWLVTIPVTIFMAAGLFLLFRWMLC